jgi:hypothetical protein
MVNDCWDETIDRVFPGVTVQNSVAVQMVDLIRQLGRLCEEADDLLDTDDPDAQSWRHAWAILNEDVGDE